VGDRQVSVLGLSYVSDTVVRTAGAPPHRTTSCVFADVDGDGDADLLTANQGAADRLFISDGGGHFADETAARWTAPADSTVDLSPHAPSGGGAMLPFPG